MPKKIVRKEEFFKKLNRVLDDLEETVIATYGPNGRTVVLEIDPFSEDPFKVTKDGVSVADALHYVDSAERIILDIIRSAAQNLNRTVGDGTTTSILFTVTLIRSVLNSIGNSYGSVKELLDDVSGVLLKVADYLEASAISVTKDDEILRKIARISSNNDESIIPVIYEAITKAGKNGIINVMKDNTELGLKVDVSNGLFISSRPLVGSLNSTYMPGNKIKSPVFNDEADSYHVLLVDGILDNTNLLGTVLTSLKSEGVFDLLIVASEVRQNVVNFISANNRAGRINCMLTEAEGFADSTMDIFQDISLVTGAEIASLKSTTPLSLRNVRVSNLGKIGKISIFNYGIAAEYYSSNVLEKPEVKTRIETLRSLYNELKKKNDHISQARITILEHRLYKFVKLAIIKVGGINKAEQSNKYDQIVDAVSAVNSAIENGVLYGGGRAALDALMNLDLTSYSDTVKRIVSDVLTSQIRKLLQNDYLPNEVSEHKKVEERIEEMRKNKNLIFNADTGKFESLKDTDIFDPARVLVDSIYNAISVLNTIFKINSMIVESQEVVDGS